MQYRRSLGVLTASAEEWAVAVRRVEVLGRLAREQRVEMAAELGISRQQVYGLLKRWRVGPGVASDLLPRRSSGGVHTPGLGEVKRWTVAYPPI
ncbi:helix-turn-helix domain-containing protein [Nonomuraea angiospora]|uniref:helix-turn-helix domain-containing protein n=1 Tax=Nonomuraea angiospora TaxID=46172 RepID=UPI003447BFEB